MSGYRIDWDTPKGAMSELIGKTLSAIRGAEAGSEQVELICTDGSIYVMHHSQDCCEGVNIESVTGDVADLIGTPILRAEEATSDKDPDGYKPENDYRESFTWTFYKLATVKGWVDIRWLGESNGYYSESVDLVRVATATSPQSAPTTGDAGESARGNP